MSRGGGVFFGEGDEGETCSFSESEKEPKRPAFSPLLLRAFSQEERGDLGFVGWFLIYWDHGRTVGCDAAPSRRLHGADAGCSGVPGAFRARGCCASAPLLGRGPSRPALGMTRWLPSTVPWGPGPAIQRHPPYFSLSTRTSCARDVTLAAQHRSM